MLTIFVFRIFEKVFYHVPSMNCLCFLFPYSTQFVRNALFCFGEKIENFVGIRSPLLPIQCYRHYMPLGRISFPEGSNSRRLSCNPFIALVGVLFLSISKSPHSETGVWMSIDKSIVEQTW
jgi:hypothetical protein